AADLGGVVQAHFTRSVALQSAGVGDVQLPGEVGHDARRDVSRIGQEGAQESHRAELHGEPEARVIAPAAGDEATILVVEVKVSLQLGWCGLARVAAVAALLLHGQEVDWHPCPLSSRQAYSRSPIRSTARSRSRRDGVQ